VRSSPPTLPRTTSTSELPTHWRAGSRKGSCPRASSAFYVFQHRFAQETGIKERWGLTARVRIARQGSAAARPHESVMEDRILDRLKLLRIARASFSPIMA